MKVFKIVWLNNKKKYNYFLENEDLHQQETFILNNKKKNINNDKFNKWLNKFILNQYENIDYIILNNMKEYFLSYEKITIEKIRNYLKSTNNSELNKNISFFYFYLNNNVFDFNKELKDLIIFIYNNIISETNIILNYRYYLKKILEELKEYDLMNSILSLKTSDKIIIQNSLWNAIIDKININDLIKDYNNNLCL